jgi:UDP-3-O-[3-hydroxymyristoyl] glucosamine N-acyltransferase
MNVKEIAELTGGNLEGAGEVEIYSVADLEKAASGEISFLEKAENLRSTNASCLIVPENFDVELPFPVIKVKNPKLAFAKVAAKLHPVKRRNGRHETAVIAENSDVRADFVGAFATIGENTSVGENAQIYDGARIGNNVSIGKNSIVFPNCIIYDNVELGENCVIHAGTVIGADGFGYVRAGANGYVKFPQIGTVIIEDDVEIGANSCVDRGALGETRIGAGTKIDNQVQIAHNVRIGKRVVIAAQTGISGSTVIEDDCVIGGQVGMGDHARVLSGAIIGSQAGILPGKIVRSGVWWGTPVQPLDEYKRQNAHVKGLARLKEEIKELKKQIAELISPK